MFTTKTKILGANFAMFQIATIASGLNDDKNTNDIVAEKNYLRNSEEQDPNFRKRYNTKVHHLGKITEEDILEVEGIDAIND